MTNTRELIVIGLAVVCALTLMSLPPSYKTSIAERCQVGLLVSGQALFSGVTRYARDEEKSRFLLTQNAALALDNMQMKEAAWENVRLRKALSFRPIDENTSVISAEVIGRDPGHIYDTIIINAGREHGVEHKLAERASCHATGQDVGRSPPEDEHDTGEHQKDDQGGQGGPRPYPGPRGEERLFGAVVEPPPGLRFLNIGLNRADACERLLGKRAGFGQRILGTP